MGVCGGVPCMHTCAHTCMQAHMHACCKHVVNMINMDASMGVAICNFYTYMCACACMCTCVGTPPMPPDAPNPPAPPQRCREPKTPKFNKS